MKITNIFKWIRQLRCYVVADPNDNSVTFSKGLYNRLDLLSYSDKPKALVFRIGGDYAFTINPDIADDVPAGEIQYNSKYKTIGFETLVPTVQRIFFDYGLNHDKPCKLSVKERDFVNDKGDKVKYYIIERPYVQHPR